MSKIIFVNPPIALEDRYGRYAAAGSHFPPLHLTSLAAVTRQHGFETGIIDPVALSWDMQTTLQAILDKSPDYVGITATTISVHTAGTLAELIKQNSPDIKILIGGVHLSAEPEKTMETFTGFDIGVVGEGDITIVELLNALDKSTDISNIEGLIYRTNDGIIQTAPRPLLRNLDSLPMPAWDLLPDLPKSYRPSLQCIRRLPSTIVMTTRGCFGKCTFCSRAIFGNKIRAYSTDYVIDTLKHLCNKYGMRDFQIEDDSFLSFHSRVIDICRRIRDEKLNISWNCLARVDRINAELLDEIKKAGCWQIQFGIESGSQEILDSIKKKITLKQVEDALVLTKKAGIRTKGFFIIGHLLETKETIQKTIEFAKRMPLDDFQLTIYTPLPGTDDYNIADRYGQFDKNWDKMSMYNPVFVANGLTTQELLQYQKSAYRQFYFRPKTIFSVMTKARSLGAAGILFSGAFNVLQELLSK
ncbi:MAG: B12-binding domain-containing radical SAM protein [Candidatus Anammoxibacter sp.]